MWNRIESSTPRRFISLPLWSTSLVCLRRTADLHLSTSWSLMLGSFWPQKLQKSASWRTSQYFRRLVAGVVEIHDVRTFVAGSSCQEGGAEFAGPENVGPQKKQWLEIATPGKWWTKSQPWNLQDLENEGPNRRGWKMQDLENDGTHHAVICCHCHCHCTGCNSYSRLVRRLSDGTTHIGPSFSWYCIWQGLHFQSPRQEPWQL